MPIRLVIPLLAAALAAPPDALAPLPVEQIPVQGLTRAVRFYRPAAAAPQAPLVIALHGSGGDGERFRRLTNGAFERLADKHGFVIAYPDALGGHWRDCRARAPYQAALEGVDDVAFLRAVAKRGAGIAGGRPSAVFVVGYSNGGHLVFRLAAEAPDAYDGFAAVGAHLPVEDEFGCAEPRAPVSMFLVSGTEDPINPWGGGDVRLPSGAALGRVHSADATAAFFRQLAGIGDDAPVIHRHMDRDLSDGTTVEARRWTNGGHEVVSLVVQRGGHVLPLPAGGFPEDMVGRTNRDVDAARLIWEFFERRMLR